jgi:AcrR family transcriptional regulator
MTGNSPPPARTSLRPGQGREEPLTRALVLSTALSIIDEEGAEGLSMRRLGKALDRNPMTLYRYAANKAALLDGVVETMLGQIVIEPSDHDWREQLRTVAYEYRRLALEHPNMVPLLVTRPLSTPLGLRPPGTLRYLEAILELLIGAGFAAADALHIFRAVFGFLNGHILNELQEIVENPAETDDLLRLGLHRLPLVEFPRLRSMATIMANYDGLDELEKGLSILLDGLATAVPPADTPPLAIPIA